MSNMQFSSTGQRNDRLKMTRALEFESMSAPEIPCVVSLLISAGADQADRASLRVIAMNGPAVPALYSRATISAPPAALTSNAWTRSPSAPSPGQPEVADVWITVCVQADPFVDTAWRSSSPTQALGVQW